MVPRLERASADSETGIFCAEKAQTNNPAQPQRPSAKFVPSVISDALLETAIEVAKQHLCEAPTRAEKLDAWREMCRLIDQRTPSRMRFMERMRGL